MSKLSQGWAETSFFELNNFLSKTIDPNLFADEQFELYSVPVFPSRKPEELYGKEIGSTKQLVEQNDVLICKINPRINRVWQVKNKGSRRQIASSEWIVLRAPQLNAPYLRYYFSSPGFRELLCSDVIGVGGSLTRAQPKQVASYPVPLAPLNEQKRITDKLDKLLARVETCREHLDRIPLILKRFRQSVLVAACSGSLSEDWRKNNTVPESASTLLERIAKKRNFWIKTQITLGNREAQRLKLKLDHLKNSSQEGNGIPDTWEWTSFLKACWLVVDCHNKTAPYVSEGIPLVRTTNIRSGKILLDDVKYVSPETYAYWSRRCPPQPGDVLFTREAPMGECAVIPPKISLCMGQRMMLLRIFPELVNPIYLSYAIQDPNFQERLGNDAVGTGVIHLRVGDVENLTFPLPPITEQNEIVRRVEFLFTYADRLEARYQAAITQVEKLTPAILAKAFRGELVPQDPNDEPASVLLERIRKERSTQENRKVNKRTRKSEA